MEGSVHVVDLSNLPQLRVLKLNRVGVRWGAAVNRRLWCQEQLEHVNRLELELDELEQLGQLKLLEQLEMRLGSGDAELPIPLVSLPRLRTLLIEAPGLSSLPENMAAALPELRQLELLSWSPEELPGSIMELPSLTSLEIHAPHLTSLPQSIVSLSRLRKLQLAHCEALERLPEFLTQLERLQQLVLRDTSITSLPAQFVSNACSSTNILAVLFVFSLLPCSPHLLSPFSLHHCFPPCSSGPFSPLSSPSLLSPLPSPTLLPLRLAPPSLPPTPSQLQLFLPTLTLLSTSRLLSFLPSFSLHSPIPYPHLLPPFSSPLLFPPALPLRFPHFSLPYPFSSLPCWYLLLFHRYLCKDSRQKQRDVKPHAQAGSARDWQNEKNAAARRLIKPLTISTEQLLANWGLSQAHVDAWDEEMGRKRKDRGGGATSGGAQGGMGVGGSGGAVGAGEGVGGAGEGVGGGGGDAAGEGSGNKRKIGQAGILVGEENRSALKRFRDRVEEMVDMEWNDATAFANGRNYADAVKDNERWGNTPRNTGFRIGRCLDPFAPLKPGEMLPEHLRTDLTPGDLRRRREELFGLQGFDWGAFREEAEEEERRKGEEEERRKTEGERAEREEVEGEEASEGGGEAGEDEGPDWAALKQDSFSRVGVVVGTLVAAHARRL
ncbi:unnamed protein product [Closterium sp. Naga37s-1]|nr:unnamed protein product [Closterium sp. Naga37s-1]